METKLKGEKQLISPPSIESDVKFYWWFLTTNYLHLVVYAIAVKQGDDYFYIEDHCMIRKCTQNNADC